MFISSMARKNDEKQRKRSKSTGSLRRSTESRHVICNETKEQQRNEKKYSTEETGEESSKPPGSIVNKSNIIFVNGLEKQLQKTRERKHLSNSAKTIQRQSSSKLRFSPNTVNQRENNSCSKDDKGEKFPGDASINKLTNIERKLLFRSGHSPDEHFVHTERRSRSSAGFIDAPEDAEWYLDPLHRRMLSNNISLSTSYLEFDDEIPGCESRVGGGHIDDDHESELDLLHLEKSKLMEEEAIARVACSSPYELELCRLRKEKLRLEESYLLKKKCDFELERTRAPKAKWYELKTPQFTIERGKYDNLMNNRKYWNEIIDYRNSLVETSSQLPHLR